PGIIQNQFGARLGGPIVHNRTFFHFAYEGWRTRTADTIVSLTYTDSARAGIFRFFPNIQNGNATASVPTVDLNGNPIRPAGAGPLQSVNIFNKDPFRTGTDPTGIVKRLLAFMPSPNNFRYGDGLTTAGFTWRQKGTEDIDQYNA